MIGALTAVFPCGVRLATSSRTLLANRKTTELREDYVMKVPGFTAEASLFRTKKAFRLSNAVRRRPQIVPQLGIGGGGGIGVTYPPGDDDCYCCTSWVKCPCGLSIA